jgi:hypothetical protein
MSNEKPSYGALARADALIAGVEEWWKVTRWPICTEMTCPYHGAMNRAEREDA